MVIVLEMIQVQAQRETNNMKPYLIAQNYKSVAELRVIRETAGFHYFEVHLSFYEEDGLPDQYGRNEAN